MTFFSMTGVLLALSLMLGATAAHAREYTVVIHHLELEQLPEKPQVGDVLTFSNEAEMAHNIYIVYDDGSMDNLDTQVPGTKKSVTLRKAGAATVRCWIHPIIKREMTIAPPTGADKK
ncbi:methylamine utilization protein MauL [Hyphomicrobium sp. 99]|uniref:methylamine utilization protein MauL n=1 Tax=Hyphomicrobium sp. 99 TaxID=1163419 RepID=UPI0006970C84|nr:methylamine utilization protein MauL [Hyphomicrobium sp. 99]